MIDKRFRSQKQKLFEESADRTPHYSIRKYAVGAASVLLSTTLWMGANAGAVHADTVDGSATTEQVNTADQSSATASTATVAETQKQAPAAATASTAPAANSASSASATASAETASASQATTAESQKSTEAAASEAPKIGRAHV